MKKTFVGKGTPIERINKDSDLFRACTVVKQVAMEMGVGELFEI